MNGDWSTLRAGVGSLEAGLLVAKRPARRGGGEIAAWRNGGWFFLLGGGEPVNAAIDEHCSERRDALGAWHVPLALHLLHHARRRIRQRQQRRKWRRMCASVAYLNIPE